MTNLEIKANLYQFCLSHIENKHDQLQESIDDAQNSLSSESKSTAGDKHDTGRAMMHLEIEKKGQQLAELEKLKRVMIQFSPNKLNSTIDLGTAIRTNHGNYFLSIGIGRIELEDEIFYAISLASPLAQNIKNSYPTKAFEFLNKSYSIKEIF